MRLKKLQKLATSNYRDEGNEDVNPDDEHATITYPGMEHPPEVEHCSFSTIPEPLVQM